MSQQISGRQGIQHKLTFVDVSPLRTYRLFASKAAFITIGIQSGFESEKNTFSRPLAVYNYKVANQKHFCRLDLSSFYKKTLPKMCLVSL